LATYLLGAGTLRLGLWPIRFKGKKMTKQKGPKRAKTEFSVMRIERKQTRHLAGPALVEAMAKIAATKRKTLETVKA
jgi:hypothetical protein